MGRPPTRPAKLKDGFYIEVHNKWSNSGIKIRRETKEEMLSAAKGFARTKDVVILGEMKKGKWLSEKRTVEKS